MLTFPINKNTHSVLFLNTRCCQIQVHRSTIKVTILFTTIILLQPLSCLSAATASN